MVNTAKSNWYSVRVRPNCEQKVCDRIKLEMTRQNKNVAVVIPKERVITSKNGKKIVREKVLYAGNIFVQSDNIAEIRYLIKDINDAYKINGTKDGTPTPLRQHEIDEMIKNREEMSLPVLENDSFIQGETVKIIEGAFSDFIGTINSMDDNKVKLTVKVFGRAQIIELDNSYIVKI
jgi:transcriptional antiterminator NusG